MPDPVVLLGDRCHCCGSGGGFCDCVHNWPRQISIVIPAATVRNYLPGIPDVPVGIPAGLVGDFTLDGADVPPGTPAPWQKVYSGAGCKWKVWAYRAFPGDQIQFGVYAKWQDGGNWYLAYRQVFGCRGAFKVDGDSVVTFPPNYQYAPDALSIYALFGLDGVTPLEPAEAVPQNPVTEAFYARVYWYPCPVAPPAGWGGVVRTPGFFHYVHLQLLGPTLNDRTCCNAVRGKFCRADFTVSAGTCSVLTGATLGGAFPVGYGEGDAAPFCCLKPMVLQSFLHYRHGEVVDGDGTVTLGINELARLEVNPADFTAVLHSRTTSNAGQGDLIGLLDTATCSETLTPHGDCRSGSWYYEAYLLSAFGANLCNPTGCDFGAPVAGSPCTLGGPAPPPPPESWTGVTVRITITAAGGLLGDHTPDLNLCDTCA